MLKTLFNLNLEAHQSAEVLAPLSLDDIETLAKYIAMRFCLLAVQNTSYGQRLGQYEFTGSYAVTDDARARFSIRIDRSTARKWVNHVHWLNQII
ncbi:MAG: hypothetical protein HY872_02565 [Chloroflexi bacterium]|nr:hypothetical protein [Chloroflexota bacterium]